MSLPADVMENLPMLDLLWRVRSRWHLHVRGAIADTTYGTAENIRALEEAGIRAYVPLPDWEQRTSYYGARRCHYDAERDEYRCPQAQPLRPYPVDLAAYYERVRADHGTPAYQKAMRKRAVWVEPLFGEAKGWRGLRRFRLRGVDRVNIEGLLVAAGQNLKRWLTTTGWGRRPAAI